MFEARHSGRNNHLLPKALVRPLSALAFLAVLSGVSGKISSVEAQASQVTEQTMIVPLYVDPNLGNGKETWKKTCSILHGGSVVADPFNGPGPEFNQNYDDVIRYCLDHGVGVLGNVNTNYGITDLNSIMTDIDHWLAWYPELSGIFVNQMGTDPSTKDYYQAIHDRVKTSDGRRVVGDPGTASEESGWHKQVADIVIIYEGEGAGFDTTPSWTKTTDTDRLGVLLYGVPTGAEMQDLVDKSRTENIGSIYVTQGTQGNQWNGIPDYFKEERLAVMGPLTLHLPQVSR